MLPAKTIPALRQLAFLLLFTLLAQLCHAETLYQRSSALFEAKARQAAPDAYSFVVMGDSRGNDAVFKKALQVAASFDPLFILHAGDYSDEGGRGETAHFLDLVQRGVPGIPFFVVLGNHENLRVFETEVGPRNFVLNSRRLGLKLIALNNAEEALLAPELALLRAELASASGSVFVSMHVPPETKRWRGHTFTQGAAELEQILAGSRRVQGIFFAHSHLFDSSEFGGVPAFITGGAGAPLVWYSRYGERVHHILVVRVKNGQASYQMVPLR